MKAAQHANDDAPLDRGETLIELLVTMMIMGTAVVALLGGLNLGVRVADIHRKQAQAGAYLRDFAETVEAAVARPRSAYTACAGGSTYESEYSLNDSVFRQPRVPTVRYWDGSAFTGNCSIATDTGLQELSLVIETLDGRVSETLVIIIRKPCRSVADFGEPLCT